MTMTAIVHAVYRIHKPTVIISDAIRNVTFTTNMASGVHWPSANVTTSRDQIVTMFSAYYGVDAEQTTAVMLGHIGVTNGSLPTRTVSEAVKNHTVMVSCLMFGAGVFGNLLALFVLATSSAEQRKTLFYKLVAGLAVTDLLGTTAVSPVVIAVYSNNFQWVGGDALCHYFSFAMIFACFATLFIVCAMSVERYICVRHPYIYHTRLSGTKFARLTLLLCWALSMVIASLPLLGIGTNVKQYPKTWCFFDYLSHKVSDRVFNYLFAILALVCVLVTFICNVSVIYTLVNLRSRQSRLDASESSQAKRRSRATSQRFAEVQMMIMLIGITIVFTFCFAPLIIFVLVCQTGLQFDTRSWVLTLIRIASFNPILDPWVYILFRRELVWRCVKLCRCILRLEPKHRPRYFQQSLLVKEPDGGVVTNGAALRHVGSGNGAVKTHTDGSRRLSWDDPYNPSCLAFCYQCLCLPPAPRTSIITSWGLSFTASKINRSPSLMTSRKLPSGAETSQTALSRSTSRLAMQPPSPSDRLLLIKMTEAGGSSRSVNSVV